MLAVEGASQSATDAHVNEGVRVCEKLQVSLTRFAGADGFTSLLRRALALARAEVPALQRIEVKPSYGLSHEDMADMLYDSLENAEADMTARLLTEARVEARRSLLALDAALAKDGSLLAAEERAALDAGRARLEGAMAGDSRDEINAAAEALEELSKPFAERRMDRGIRDALSGLSVKELESRVGE